MRFVDRINAVFEGLGCTNAEIAASAGFHSSGISRFRRGERTPSPRSGQLMAMCEGICAYAEAEGLLPRLRTLCEAPEATAAGALPAILFSWLLSGDLAYHAPRHGAAPCATGPYTRLFSDKLNLLMTKLGVTNVRMAQALHVNPSVISRFRNRVRFPSSDAMVRDICGVLYDCAARTGQAETLASITGMPEQTLHSRTAAIAHLAAWMADAAQDEALRMTDAFLSRLDSFTPGTFPPLPPLEAVAPASVREEDTRVYQGMDGLRRAVVRFLGSTASLDESATLLLYSDQDMRWMTADADYYRTWAALMVHAIRAKARIRIIHNIDRSLPEMIRAIEGWLPLYLSGQLEAYVHKRDAGGRFCHTLFVSPQREAIVACFPQGMEAVAQYSYAMGEDVAYYTAQLTRMLEDSTPIVRVFPPQAQGVQVLHRALHEHVGELVRLLSTPSLETMTVETLRRVLTDTNEVMRARIEDEHARRSALLASALHAGTVVEYVCLPSGELPRLGLQGGADDAGFCYTEETLALHLRDMEAFAQTHPTYRFMRINESIFPNLQITVKASVGGWVVKSGPGVASNSYWHAMMADAFCAYITHRLALLY